MNILVSDTTKTYEGWLVLRTLGDVERVVGNIDNLVYYRSKEPTDEKIKHLSNIYKNKVNCKITYVCNKDKVDNAVRMLITGGLKGKYIDDEFFLDDVRELNSLITDLAVVADTKDLSSSTVLTDFFNRYINGESSGISKGYLQVVKNAALEMTEAYHAKSVELLQMSESAAEIFSNSVELITQMKEQQSNLERDLNKLRESKKELEAFEYKPSSIGSSVMYYPRVTYMKNKTIIKIKDLCNCDYLFSFLLGFRDYLDKIKLVRPKLIVIEPIGKCIEDYYADFDWVTSVSKNDSRKYYGSVTFCNCPTSGVLSKLLNDTNFDTFVVLDRTVNYKEHILNSKGNVLYAVNGMSMLKKFKIQKSKCILTKKEIEGSLLSIPFFNDYPERDDQRVNLYLKECTALYELLYDSRFLK